MQCKNCGAEANGKYCPNCGQLTSTGRLTVRELLFNFWDVFTHAEHGIFRAIKELTLTPAHIAREYISGKRKKYFSPVKYLVVIVTLSAILILNYSSFGLPFEPSFPKDSGVDDVVEQDYFNHKNYKIQLFLSIPLASLISWLIFRRSGFNYSENLVLNTYLLSQVILFHTLLITPSIILASPEADQWIVVFYLSVSVIYITLAYTSFYPGKKYFGFIKALITVILFSSFYNLISQLLRNRL
jgi:hypothetical protein